jgi:hypothetical protein
MHFNIAHPPHVHPSGLIPCGFLTNITYAFLFPPIHATGLADLILLDLIIQILLAQEYKL